MFQRLKNLMKPKECAICHNKPERSATYLNDKGEKVEVCYKCVSYAERRAFRREV